MEHPFNTMYLICQAYLRLLKKAVPGAASIPELNS